MTKRDLDSCGIPRPPRIRLPAVGARVAGAREENAADTESRVVQLKQKMNRSAATVHRPHLPQRTAA